MPSPDESDTDIPNGWVLPSQAEQFLSGVLAKSASHSGAGRPETLTRHSLATRDAALAVAGRIGSAGLLADYPRFWTWVAWAALLHDAGKIAAGFQNQLSSSETWGERHEVLSLAYVDLLTAGLPEADQAMIAAGVAFHHRCLDGSGGLDACYPPDADWEKKFGVNPAAPAGRRAQVNPRLHTALLAWLAARLGIQPPPPGGDRKLWQRARDRFADVAGCWSHPVGDAEGLVAALLQGAVTLADHSASAHVALNADTPLPFGYLKSIATPYPHQSAAAAADGHLILVSPTGSGKTEAGLGWASLQLESMPGLPRLVWLLPYRASINAIRDRFARDFQCDANGIGVLHATAATALLNLIVGDDHAPGRQDARKARAMAGAMRLFQQRVRVATPHQLLRAAIGGPKYSSILLEQANSIFVLDELHAYDPVTFGRICAAMRLWETLGSRIAVISATLAQPMIDLIRDSLASPVTVVRAAPGTAPPRHRLVLDSEPLTTPRSLDRIRAWLAEGHSVLVVCNTVATAQHVFRELAPDAGDEAALLLHSRFRYRDRAKIEELIMRRHPERSPGEPAMRSGGLVVSTQVLEVSLCLDFDRGASEVAPVEAIAQRAGRVNRRGRHPGGAVEFRVHPAESALPYDEGAVEAAMLALRDSDGKVIGEQDIDRWLGLAYETPWGRQWAAEARESSDEFHELFLTFPDPFADRSEFADKLDEQFDTVEVLLSADLNEYRQLATGPDGDPMLAAGLLIPVSIRQKAILAAKRDTNLGVWVADADYSEHTGLELARRRAPDWPEDTIL